MKKKLLAILLAALMVVPFTVISTMGVSAEGTADKVTLPAEPQPYRDITVYVSYKSTSGVQSSDSNAGTSADTLLGTFGSGVFPLIEIPGGVICIPGKGYVGSNYTFPKCGNPVTVTAFDPQLNKRYEGTLEVIAEDGTVSNGSQLGMFMIYQDRTLQIAGDYIFENIDIIERCEDPNWGDKTSKISVIDGGKLVIKDDVRIMKMSNANENVILNVDAGGYAYLHAVGFEKYTGDGVIVMTKALYDQVKVDTDAFIEFRGAVVDPDGTILLGEMPEIPGDDDDAGNSGNDAADSSKPSSKPSDKPAETDKTTTAATTDATTDGASDNEAGDFPIAIVIGGVAAAIVVAVVIIIIVKKKKA